MKILPLALFIIPFLAGCGANNTPPQTPIPGEKTSAKLRTLETGAGGYSIQTNLSMPSVPTLTGSIFIAVIKTDRWKRTITLPS
ncbi:Putative outer membrane or secretedlipoprotein [Salmonella enterica subsp. enterica]|uniref:Outer membrane or secretedlipoprotein n=1 Tax=Salmonella enterica I TaxID=59201 RepID=A0A447MSP8_SALET|nr:Putative outer membrane or secretedlipoprotein [Salmonella enterica subsp. enterica]